VDRISQIATALLLRALPDHPAAHLEIERPLPLPTRSPSVLHGEAQEAIPPA
jgi:hypothetical protein